MYANTQCRALKSANPFAVCMTAKSHFGSVMDVGISQQQSMFRNLYFAPSTRKLQQNVWLLWIWSLKGLLFDHSLHLFQVVTFFGLVSTCGAQSKRSKRELSMDSYRRLLWFYLHFSKYRIFLNTSQLWINAGLDCMPEVKRAAKTINARSRTNAGA